MLPTTKQISFGLASLPDLGRNIPTLFLKEAENMAKIQPVKTKSKKNCLTQLSPNICTLKGRWVVA